MHEELEQGKHSYRISSTSSRFFTLVLLGGHDYDKLADFNPVARHHRSEVMEIFFVKLLKAIKSSTADAQQSRQLK